MGGYGRRRPNLDFDGRPWGCPVGAVGGGRHRQIFVGFGRPPVMAAGRPGRVAWRPVDVAGAVAPWRRGAGRGSGAGRHGGHVLGGGRLTDHTVRGGRRAAGRGSGRGASGGLHAFRSPVRTGSGGRRPIMSWLPVPSVGCGVRQQTPDTRRQPAGLWGPASWGDLTSYREGDRPRPLAIYTNRGESWLCPASVSY